MGTWGTEIFEDDMACDVRDIYQDMIGNGVSCEEATNKILKDYESDLNKFPETANIFWLALAKAQIEAGETDKRIIAKAIEMIDDGIDILNWKKLDADPETIKERQEVLKIFRVELEPHK